MRTGLAKATRWRSAGLLAVAYLICVLAPAAAFAFGDGSRAAHCLTDDHHGLRTNVHLVAHNSGDHHEAAADALNGKSEPDDPGMKVDDGQCCGLVCLSALPAAILEIRPPALPRGPAETARLQKSFVEHAPPGLFRPPLSPLPH